MNMFTLTMSHRDMLTHSHMFAHSLNTLRFAYKLKFKNTYIHMHPLILSRLHINMLIYSVNFMTILISLLTWGPEYKHSDASRCCHSHFHLHMHILEIRNMLTYRCTHRYAHIHRIAPT